MQEKLNDVFTALQELDIKATPHNVSILNGVFEILREIYKELGESENVGSESK